MNHSTDNDFDLGRSRRTIRSIGMALVVLVLGCETALAADPPDDRPVITVGIVYDGRPPDQEIVSLSRFLVVPEQIRRETTELTRRDFDVRFPEDKRWMGGWDLNRIETALDQALADPDVDIVLTLGVFASNIVCRRRELPIPVIAPFAVDPTAQSLPLVDNTSGVENLSYLIRRGNVLQDLRTFKEKLVSFDRLHVLVDSMFIEAIAEIPAYVAQLDEQIGAKATLVPVGHSADEALALLDDAEAVYIAPLMRMPAVEFERLVAGLIDRKLPSFSLQGQVEVERGVLAGLRRATDTARISRRIALHIQRILLGDDAGTLPVRFEQPERLLINMGTADAIGVHPRWRVTLEADLIQKAWPWGHTPTAADPLSLSTAVLEAVEANLSLKATDRGVAAGAESIRFARSLYKPRVEAAVEGFFIDEDDANILQPERTGTASLRATQILYSDAVHADVAVTGQLQLSLELQREVERLDVALAAASAFLNVLRAQTLESIEQDNLRLTESNLDLAVKRESIGFSGPADVYRWESELATVRSEVIKAHAQLHAAFIVLNRILDRPLEGLYEAETPSLEDPHLIAGTGRLHRYIDNQAGFDLFREFSAREGLVNSVELQAIDAQISVEERRLTAAKRSYWAPEVTLFGEAYREFTRDGTGSEGTLPPPLAIGDRDSWSVGLNLTLPLYTGGSRSAEVRRASERLAQLRLERELLAQAVEARVRTTVFAISATFPTIELAGEAETAAGKNLDLVTDSYSRGVVSIIDLLDAQNAALVAEQFSSNAVYDFLLDLMELQRATSDFDFFRSDEGRDAWFARLEEFFVGVDDPTSRR